jgi:hypothetical protein
MIARPAIGGPFRDIAKHVRQPRPVGGVGADRPGRRRAVIAGEPRRQGVAEDREPGGIVQIVEPAGGAVVSAPRHAFVAASGIFPLRLGRQAMPLPRAGRHPRGIGAGIGP